MLWKRHSVQATERSNNGRPMPTAMDTTQPKPTSTTDTPAPAGTTNSKPAPTHCPSDNNAQRAPNTSNSAAPPISTGHNLTTENSANVHNQTSTTPQVQSPLTPFRSYRNQKFEDGTAAIPDAIHELCKQIRGCKRHKSTLLPVRLDLRTHMPDHFLSSNGTMRSGSPLNEWFGDTRLFTREEWLYLKGKKLESSDGGN